MPINKGDRLPSANLLHMGENGPESIETLEYLKGKRAVIVGMPGAYTSTCTEAHIPSLVRNAEALKAKGIDEIIVFAANDLFIMDHWGKSTGASEAGITMLADWDSSFTKALGLEFTAPPVGFINRTTRCGMIVNDGTVEVLQLEEERGVCAMTSGETLLAEA